MVLEVCSAEGGAVGRVLRSERGGGRGERGGGGGGDGERRRHKSAEAPNVRRHAHLGLVYGVYHGAGRYSARAGGAAGGNAPCASLGMPRCPRAGSQQAHEGLPRHGWRPVEVCVGLARHEVCPCGSPRAPRQGDNFESLPELVDLQCGLESERAAPRAWALFGKNYEQSQDCRSLVLTAASGQPGAPPLTVLQRVHLAGLALRSWAAWCTNSIKNTMSTLQ